MDEFQLVEKLQQGEEQAFRWLVDQYKNKVAATCYGYTGDYDAARDLAQDVFFEVHRSIAKFRGDAKLSTWIYRISINKSINWLRDNKKHRFTTSIERHYTHDENQELVIRQEDGADGMEVLNREDDHHKIQEALNQLPENQKKAFVLNKIDDLSYKEVAETMEVSLATVESLIFRARKNLQQHLKEYYTNRKD